MKKNINNKIGIILKQLSWK